MFRALLPSVFAAMMFILPAQAEESCGFGSNGDYGCGDEFHGMSAQGVESGAFFSSAHHPDLQFGEDPTKTTRPDEVTREDFERALGKMSTPEFSMEQLGERMDEITRALSTLNPTMQEIAVEKIMANMTMEEIANYKGRIIERKAGGRTFLGKPLVERHLDRQQ